MGRTSSFIWKINKISGYHTQQTQHNETAEWDSAAARNWTEKNNKIVNIVAVIENAVGYLNTKNVVSQNIERTFFKWNDIQKDNRRMEKNK